MTTATDLQSVYDTIREPLEAELSEYLGDIIRPSVQHPTWNQGTIEVRFFYADDDQPAHGCSPGILRSNARNLGAVVGRFASENDLTVKRENVTMVDTGLSHYLLRPNGGSK